MLGTETRMVLRVTVRCSTLFLHMTFCCVLSSVHPVWFSPVNYMLTSWCIQASVTSSHLCLGDNGPCNNHVCEFDGICVVKDSSATCKCPVCSEAFEPVRITYSARRTERGSELKWYRVHYVTFLHSNSSTCRVCFITFQFVSRTSVSLTCQFAAV